MYLAVHFLGYEMPWWAMVILIALAIWGIGCLISKAFGIKWDDEDVMNSGRRNPEDIH